MREEIIKMAREAGLRRQQHTLTSHPVQYRYSYEGYEENLERFFHMAQAAERSNWPAEMEAMERQVNILTDELAKAVAAEREACAKVCEDGGKDESGRIHVQAWGCAKAIRARGQA